MPLRPGEMEWDDIELAKKTDTGKIPQFLVKEYERALFIRDGKIYEEFGPGRHTTSKLSSATNAHLIYVSLVPFKLKWGLPETMTQDNVTVGCSGTIELQVDNPKMFWAQVIGAKTRYTKDNMKDHILSNLQGVIRTELANLTVKQVYLERDVLIAAVRARLQEMFGSMGIDYKRLELVGINVPQKIKEALESTFTHSIDIGKKKAEQDLELEKVTRLAANGVDAASMRELEIAGDNPDILKKKYESQAYKDALETSKTQTVNVVAGVPPVQPVGQQPATPPQPAGKSCPCCGKAIQADFNMCPYCGESCKIKVCSKCGQNLKPEFKVCPYCGESA